MDTSSLPPADAAVALRSFPRRFRELLDPSKPDGIPPELLEAPGPGGRSAAELIADTTRSLALRERAVEQTLVTDRPTLHPATMRRTERDFALGATDADQQLSELGDVASRLADRIDAVRAEDWNRAARLVGGDEVAALDLVREAVSTGADNLRELQALADELA